MKVNMELWASSLREAKARLCPLFTQQRVTASACLFLDGTAEQMAQDLAPSAWQRLSAGDGTKGPRLFDWAYLELSDDGEECGTNGIWTRGLVIRRSVADGERAFFSMWCPAGTDVGVSPVNRHVAGLPYWRPRTPLDA